MLNRLFLVFALSLLTPFLSAATDCQNQRNRTERTVCADPELIKIDRQLTDVFDKALAGLTGTARKNLEGDQASWADSSGGCFNDKACVKKRYLDRIAMLEKIIAAVPATKPASPESNGSSATPARTRAQIAEAQARETHQQSQSRGASPSQEIAERTKAEETAIAEHTAKVQEEQRIRKEQQQAAFRAERDSTTRFLRLEEQQAQLVEELNALRQPNQELLLTLKQRAERETLLKRVRVEYLPSTEMNAALQKEVGELEGQLAQRKAAVFDLAKRVLAEMKQRAASMNLPSLGGPFANASAEFNKRSAELGTAIEKGDARQAIRLMDPLRKYVDELQIDRALYSEFTAWEARRRVPTASSNEASVQGIQLGSTYADVLNAVGSSCPDLKGARQDNLRYITTDCVVIGGRKRFTIFEFGGLDNEADAQLKALQGKGTGEVYRWALNRIGRRLIHLEVDLGKYTEADFRDTLSALKSKYRLVGEPTAAEIERFNRLKIETRTFTRTGRSSEEPVRYEFYPRFDANEIDHYLDDFRVWLAVRHIASDINLSVHYVASQIADDVRKQREAAKLKPSEF